MFLTTGTSSPVYNNRGYLFNIPRPWRGDPQGGAGNLVCYYVRQKIKRPNGRLIFCGGGTGTHSGKALRAKRDNFAAFHLQNLLIFEPFVALQL